MKLPLLPFLSSFFRTHVIALAVALLAAALAVGGWYGWRYYQYRQSLDFAYARFQDALQPPSPEKLALLVDFDTLSGELAQALAKAFPFFKKGPDQIRDLKNTIQTGLLKKLLSKEDPKPGGEAETDPKKLLQQPLSLFPADFLHQFLSGLGMQHAQGGTALISTSIRHPLLNRTFPVILRMENGPGGWMIRNLLNADELVGQFRQALVTRIAARRDLFMDKNKSIRRRMDATLPVQSCIAGAGLLSDGKTLLLVAHVLARNTSSVTVKNTDLEALFTGPDGKMLLQRFLNAAVPVAPGEDFDHRWTIELDGQSPLGQSVLAAKEISCAAKWKTMTLSSGEVLHIADIPPAMKECDKAGHNHPVGLCLSPIFN